MEAFDLYKLLHLNFSSKPSSYTGTRGVIPGRDQGVLSTSEHSLVVQGNHEERHAGPSARQQKLGWQDCKLRSYETKHNYYTPETNVAPENGW